MQFDENLSKILIYPQSYKKYKINQQSIIGYYMWDD